MPEELQSTAKKLYARIIASVVSFLVFVGLAVNAYLIEKTGDLSVLAIIPLAIAVLILPRHSRRGLIADVDIHGDEEEEQKKQALIERISSLGTLSTALRAIYLLLTLGILLLMPRFL